MKYAAIILLYLWVFSCTCTKKGAKQAREALNLEAGEVAEPVGINTANTTGMTPKTRRPVSLVLTYKLALTL